MNPDNKRAGNPGDVIRGAGAAELSEALLSVRRLLC